MTTATQPRSRRTWRSRARHRVTNGRFYAVVAATVFITQTVSDTVVKITELMAR